MMPNKKKRKLRQQHWLSFFFKAQEALDIFRNEKQNGKRGALIASLLEVDIKKSSIAILCGLFMASAIMYIVSYGIVGNVVH